MPDGRARHLAVVLLLGALASTALAAPTDGNGLGSMSLGGLAAGTRVWGALRYQAVAADGSTDQPGAWVLAQESGVTLHASSEAGAQLLGEFVVRREADQVDRTSSVIQQLSVRLVPSSSLAFIAGRQRLDWGTAKVFSAIDTLEVRANPLDVRSFPAGVTGLKAVYLPDDRIGLSLVALPERALRLSRAAARIDLVADELDLDLGLGLVAYPYHDRAIDAAARPARRGSFAVLSDGAWSLGPLVLYEELQLRRGREVGYRFPDMTAFEPLGGRDRLVFRGVAGGLLQAEIGLTRPLTLVTEYLFNGDGLRRGEALDFAARYDAWRGAPPSSDARLPTALAGLGGFRRHYLAVGAQGLALRRDLLLGAMGIFGLESGLLRLSSSLEWFPTQETSVKAGYEHFLVLVDRASQPSELAFIPFRQRVTASFTASF